MMNLFFTCLDIISSLLRTTKKFVVSFELFSQLNFILIDYHFCIFQKIDQGFKVTDYFMKAFVNQIMLFKKGVNIYR